MSVGLARAGRSASGGLDTGPRRPVRPAPRRRLFSGAFIMANMVRGRGPAVATFCAVALASCARGPSTDTLLPGDPKRMTVQLSSPAFPDGGAIPRVYTCDGQDVSPPLAW